MVTKLFTAAELADNPWFNELGVFRHAGVKNHLG